MKNHPVFFWEDDKLPNLFRLIYIFSVFLYNIYDHNIRVDPEWYNPNILLHKSHDVYLGGFKPQSSNDPNEKALQVVATIL